MKPAILITAVMALASSLASTTRAQEPAIEYGGVQDLKGTSAIYIHVGTEMEVRDNIWKNISKELPNLTLANTDREADVILVFGGSASTTYAGTVTNSSKEGSADCQGQATTYGRTTYGSASCTGSSSGTSYSIPMYRTIVQGQGLVVTVPAPNRVRVILKYGDVRKNIFERRPSTNFARAFVKAYREANPDYPQGVPATERHAKPATAEETNPQQALFVEKSTAVVEALIDSLKIAGVLADRFRRGATTSLTNLYATNPSASIADIKDALWTHVSVAGRARSRFYEAAVAVVRPRLDRLPADTALRARVTRKAATLAADLMARNPDADSLAIDTAIAPAFERLLEP